MRFKNNVLNLSFILWNGLSWLALFCSKHSCKNFKECGIIIVGVQYLELSIQHFVYIVFSCFFVI